ncbi:hypothetical protein N658DRAFT_362735 [Parathielavia hyrcaniae]|uniref:Uncharacterized protein n=1 Tax=Parathielavia hyrcaniae TaxID=113614 RepID=A0AAN6SWX6_9PEZI|nr:hypothetical protein N658DRAFT_362735 [Parathielavia hyrcaniae]
MRSSPKPEWLLIETLTKTIQDPSTVPSSATSRRPRCFVKLSSTRPITAYQQSLHLDTCIYGIRERWESRFIRDNDQHHSKVVCFRSHLQSHVRPQSSGPLRKLFRSILNIFPNIPGIRVRYLLSPRREIRTAPAQARQKPNLVPLSPGPPPNRPHLQ